jgi:hypothetical protein
MQASDQAPFAGKRGVPGARPYRGLRTTNPNQTEDERADIACVGVAIATRSHHYSSEMPPRHLFERGSTQFAG